MEWLGAICGHPVFLAAAGTTVGIGIIIFIIMRFGDMAFTKRQKRGEPEECELPVMLPEVCGAHQMVIKLLETNEKERTKMWDSLTLMGNDLSEIKGMLSLLLKGARVRWNSALPPEK